MAASLTAALSVARLTPVAALTPILRRGGAAFLPVRGPISYGTSSLLRRPGRLLAGALTIALGSGSLLFLTAINHAFAGAIVGNLLGDAVALQTRTSDLIAATLLAVLGLVSTAVILYLGITDDAESLASLKATGWRDTMLATSILTQAGLLGLVGSVLGSGLALIAVRLLTPTLPADLAWLTLTIVAGTLVAALTTALVPALHLRTLPLTELLSRD